MDQVRERSGRVDVLLHAAGVEISRNLPEKEPREFDLVFDVKTDRVVQRVARRTHDGGRRRRRVLVRRGPVRQQRPDRLRRCQRPALQDRLDLRATRPQTRGLALDWTAWGGIGMATRGSIPKIMEMAGVQVLPPEAGVAWIRRELIGLGVLVARSSSRARSGSWPPSYHETRRRRAGALPCAATRGPMVGDVTRRAP